MSINEPSSFFGSDVEKERLSSSDDLVLRRVAAIDIGTNSTHLLVASVDPSLHTFSIDHAEKATTRLGERDLESGELTDFAMERALEALKRFKELGASYEVVSSPPAYVLLCRQARLPT